MEVTGNPSTTSVHTISRVSSSVDKSYSNSSGMNNQVLSDQQNTKVTTRDLSTMALCTLDGGSFTLLNSFRRLTMQLKAKVTMKMTAIMNMKVNIMKLKITVGMKVNFS